MLFCLRSAHELDQTNEEIKVIQAELYGLDFDLTDKIDQINKEFASSNDDIKNLIKLTNVGFT